MAKEILKIRIDDGLGDNNPTFKDIELDDYSGKFPRMGFPELTATLMWPTPLDDEWTHKEYVVLRGEKFYVTDTPDAEKTSDKIPYKHDLGFTSEFARILGNTFFEDAVPSYSETYDKPCSNSSKFTFYGTISEFCDRLNCSFIKAGIADSILKTKTSLSTLDTPVGDGYCVMLDPYGEDNIYDPDKTYEFSWEDKSHWEAITEGFSKTEIPFERRGKCVVFGAIPKVVDHKFEYGHDNELLSVKHKNAKAKVVNRITMVGSSENIPHYYPNETEYGHISIAPKTGNKVLSADNVQIANMTQLLSRLNADSFAVLGKYDGVDVGNADVEPYLYSMSFDDGVFGNYILGQEIKHEPNNTHNTYALWHMRVAFRVTRGGVVECRNIKGGVWKQNDAPPTLGVDLIEGITPESLKSMANQPQGVQSVDYSSQIEQGEDYVSLGWLGVGEYIFQFAVKIQNRGAGRGEPVTSWCRLDSISIEPAAKQKTGYYWDVDGKKYDGVGALGVKIVGYNVTDAMIGDGFGWVASGRMPFQDHLIPPKYRNTLGAERFYNALNAPYSEAYALAHLDAYIDPDTNNPYVFPNPFVAGAPSEHIFRDDERKPTIEGMTNASGQLMGVIADIAYDADDNDVLKPDSTDSNDKNDSLKYEHSFFYIKLNIFNGQYGFDLFAHASQTDAMTIQMREGSCNGCKFKIQAVKFTDETGLETYKNPIIVQGGKAVGVVSEDGIKESDLDPTQQNTQTHSIWICVQKDADTFGAIMPNQSNKFLPKIGDKFNIINIDLPLPYWYAAEKRLEEDGMRDMFDNNEEKFTFDIQASRIFFAENPQVLAQLDEYSVIKVKYNGREYEQYVNQFTIDCKANEALPNIGIDLTDTLAVGQSFVEQVAERASSLISNPYTMGGALGGSGGGLTTRLADLRYLKKTEADRSKGKVASDVGFEVGEFVSGGSGGIFYQDPETGQTYLEVDKIKARMKAIFAELEVAKEQSIGGKFDITPGGGIDISFVEETPTSYRCYFKAKDEDKGADCRFVVGDQARCQESNIADGTTQNASNRYYWRLVTAVNNNESYIELSKTDCDTGSDAPMAGDTVVQLGNRDNPERQSAIVLSTVDAFAPCVTLYNGIDHYSLDGKSVVEYGVDKTQDPPEPFFNCYGRFFFGPKGGNSYLKFEPSVGKLIFSGELINISTLNGKDIDEYIKGVVPPVTQEDIESYVEAIVDPKIEGIQNQIDGVIETWFGDGAPSLDRTEYPMNQWGDSTNEAHSGDLYYDNTTGYAYRFSKDDNTWKWITITDEAITKALAAAQDAKDVADGKRRVFTSQPTANDVYDEGDLWVNATYGTQYSNDILRCITPKTKGEAFDIAHWTLASKYTDDSALNQFVSDYEDTIDDIKGQLDGKAETWYQATDPSTAWNTADLKALHKGDLWYNTTNGTTWYWDGNQWQQQDVPKSVFDAIDGKADIFVNEDPHPYKVNDLWFLPKDYTGNSGLGNPKTDYLKGTLMVATQSSDTFNAAHWAKKDRYTDDTLANQAIEEIGGFQYIRQAIANGATITQGSLILSGLIKLGEWDLTDRENPIQTKVWAGMNGIYNHPKTIASWWGGDMVDKYYQDKIVSNIVTFEQLTTPLASGYAQALIRMDGSGYLAGGNIRWDELGNLILGNGISLGGGSTTIGDVANLFDTVESLTLLFNKFSQGLVPMKLVNGTPTETNWADISSDLSNLYAVKSKKGFYSDEFISARGLNPDGGGGSAFGRLDDWSNYNANGTDALSAKLGYGLKTDIANINTRIDNLPTTSVNPYALTIQKNGTTLGTYDGSEAKTINISDVASASALTTHIADTTVHITSAERTLWNNTSTNLSAILGSDTDNVINKYEEIVAFLDTYTEADTLAGLLSNKADKTTKISAGTGLTGGGTLAADRTLSLATSGVTAGTYTKLTVDAYGRATAGTTLSASDIPTLAISKIDGLQSAIDGKVSKAGDTMTGTLHIAEGGYLDIRGSFITGLDDGGFQFMPSGTLRAEMSKTAFYPSTSMFLGMSAHRWQTVYATNVDASNKIKIGDCEITWDADKGGLHFSKGIYSDEWISARGANADASGGVVGLDWDAIETELTANGYAKQSWVNQQGFLKSVAWGDITGKPTWIGSSKPSYAFSELTSHPTTIAGYGITDAKIANGVITLGGNTITPITSLSGYATTQWVQSQGYLTSLPAHSHSYLPLTGGTIKNGSTAIPLYIDTDATNEVGFVLRKSGVNKAWVGHDAYGARVWNAVCAKGLGVTDSGNPQFQTYTLWHSGNMGAGSGLVADMLDGFHYDRFVPRSIYNPDKGVLVTTSVAQSTNKMLLFRILGHTYSTTLVPIDTVIQVYAYEGRTFNNGYSMLNNGYRLPYVKVFYADNVVKMWIPYVSSYNSIDVYCYDTMGGSGTNLVTALANSADVSASGTAALQINPKNSALTTDIPTKVSQLTNDSGYALASALGSYLPLSGGALTGALTLKGEQYTGNYALNMNNSDIVNLNAIYTADLANAATEGYQFKRSNGNYDSIWASDGTLYFSPNGNNANHNGTYSTNNVVLHSGNVSSYAITSHQSLANYVDKTSAQEISGSKVFTGYEKFEKALMFKDSSATKGLYFSSSSDGGLNINSHTNYSYTGTLGYITPAGVIESHVSNASNWWLSTSPRGKFVAIDGGSSNGWSPVLAFKTTAGKYEIGSLGDTAYINYYLDTRTTNSYDHQLTIPKKSGTLAVTSDISSAVANYLPLTGGTLTGLLHVNVNGTTFDIGGQNASYVHLYSNKPCIFNKNLHVVGNLYAGSAYNQIVWHAGNDGAGSGLDADLLDGWHALGQTGNAIKKSGYIASTIAGLASYWGKLATINVTSNENKNIALYLHSTYSNFYGILDIGIRINNNSENYTLRMVTGNIPIDRIRLYRDSSSPRVFELWVNVGAQWGVMNGMVLSCTDRVGTETGDWVTMHTMSFNTVQSPTLSTYTTPSYVELTNNVASATKLANTRTIWGQNFNGEADIPITSVAQMPYVFFTGIDNSTKVGYVGCGGNSSDYLQLMSYTSNVLIGANGGSSDLYINTSHNVGIGTITPATKAHINGTLTIDAPAGSYVEGIRIHQSSANWCAMVLCGSDNTGASGTSANTWGIFNNNGAFYINKNGSSAQQASRLYGHANGWTVGNSATTTYALNAASFICDSWIRTTGDTGWYSQTYGGGWYMSDANWIRTYGSKNIYQNAGILRTDGTLQVGENGGTLIATNGGNVGINKTAPAYALDVTGDIKSSATVRCSVLSTSTGVELFGNLPYIDFHCGNTANDYDVRLINQTSGELKCVGTFHATVGIWSDGYVSARGQNSSDIRLKEQIRDFNATDIIRALHPVAFKWNAMAKSRFEVFRTDEIQYGLIAQETEVVAPWLVDRNMFGDGLWGVKYEKLIPILAQGVKEVTFTVDDLVVRVKRLERENEELKKEIAELKAR